MGDLSMFIPITKVDAKQRLVYGVATAEVEDRAGEICDYASTKPHYERWSDEIAESTGGKSLGNLRAMHGPIAAGKVTAITFNDEAKQIEICAKVVDDSEWMKVVEGVYTGFSQGGAYEGRWTDETGLTRYTAVPNEISLVDLPCLPQARFEMIKADGTRELRGFEPRESLMARLEVLTQDLIWLENLTSDDLPEVPDVDPVIDEIHGLSERLATILRSIDAGKKATRGQRTRDPGIHVDATGQAGKAATDAMLRQSAGDYRARARRRGDPTFDYNVDWPAVNSTRWGFEKRFDGLAAMLSDILQRVKNIEQQPMPLPLTGGQRAIAKHDDGSMDQHLPAAIDSLLENAETLSLLAIKLAQRNGRTPLR